MATLDGGTLSGAQTIEENAEGIQPSECLMEGYLYRKIVLVNGQPPLRNPWQIMFAIIYNQKMIFFKDYKHKSLGKATDEIALVGCDVAVAHQYAKRLHVFQVNSPHNQDIFLLESVSYERLLMWLEAASIAAQVPFDTLKVLELPTKTLGRKTSHSSLTGTDVARSNSVTTRTLTERRKSEEPKQQQSDASPSGTSTTATSSSSRRPSSTPSQSVTMRKQSSAQSLGQISLSSAKSLSASTQSSAGGIGMTVEDGERSGERPRSKARSGSITSISEAGAKEVSSPGTRLAAIRSLLARWLPFRPSPHNLIEKGILKAEPYFGCALQSVCAREGLQVPSFVQACITAVENMGMDEAGIYRVSASGAEMQKIRLLADTGVPYNLNEMETSIHNISGALKLFFRELPEPLFTYDAFPHLMALVDEINAGARMEDILPRLKQILAHLPSAHLATISTLMLHLDRITKNEEENKMGISNLAVVFGPTLVRPEHETPVEALGNARRAAVLLEKILQNVGVFFPPTAA